jgi:hypothetical protein
VFADGVSCSAWTGALVRRHDLLVKTSLAGGEGTEVYGFTDLFSFKSNFDLALLASMTLILIADIRMIIWDCFPGQAFLDMLSFRVVIGRQIHQRGHPSQPL